MTPPGSEIGSADLEEFRTLAISAGLTVAAVYVFKRTAPHPHNWMGDGHLAHVYQHVQETGAQWVVINKPLSPSQEKHLETGLQCRVVDRITLILDIFAQRARTFEGKLQVELAQLKRLSTRLIRGWTHLERQKGGIGLRGPGETQLETDRRLIKKRVAVLQSRLATLSRQRRTRRMGRTRDAVRTVALVGYTNAGKTSLFNALTETQDAWVANQLFATLDPTARRLPGPSHPAVLLTDTVGFIRQLPHDLVDAFASTLEETTEADLLLHVVDVSDPDYRTKMDTVAAVLHDIGAADVPRLEVFNKIDQLVVPGAPVGVVDGGIPRVWVSVRTGAGLSALREAIRAQLAGRYQQWTVQIPSHAGAVRSALYAAQWVRHETWMDPKPTDPDTMAAGGAWQMTLWAPEAALRALLGPAGWDTWVISTWQPAQDLPAVHTAQGGIHGVE